MVTSEVVSFRFKENRLRNEDLSRLAGGGSS
jgi:hypothetical protein